jgi:hypothetical protein
MREFDEIALSLRMPSMTFARLPAVLEEYFICGGVVLAAQVASGFLQLSARQAERLDQLELAELAVSGC